MTPITRRAALIGLGAGALAAAAPLPGRRGYPWPLGVQLWSVDAELERDFAGTLAALARLGFREVETAGLHGHPPEAFRAALLHAGLTPVSAHFGMPELLANPAGSIRTARTLGVRWLVCSAPDPGRPLPPGDWIMAMHGAMTLPAWHRNAAALNRLGREAQAAGLSFAYHNHPFDLARYDGRRGYDVLLAETDPALVKLELDVAWAVAGGADPVAILRGHPDRVRMIHLKGLAARPVPGRFGPAFSTGVLGAQDVIDWPAVLAAARTAGVAHAFVEQEPPHRRPIMASLARCRDYLERV